MVFTVAQTTAFFTDADQLAITAETRIQLATEGLANVEDLAEFDDESLKQITDNLRRPGGRIPDPNPGAAPGATIATPSFIFGAKSQLRLKAAITIARYYETVGRVPSAGNMRWNPVIKTFIEHWKALKARKETANPEVPKISKTLHIMKWTEAFSDFARRVVGTRTIPLSYVIRDEVTVPAAAPALMANQPYAEVFGSVEEELMARASHTHALYREDNAALYFFLEEATRSTMYASSIQPFSRRKDGRGAWTAITKQYAGKDKWASELKLQDDLLHTRKWKGQTNFSLDKFISQHRNAFVSMQQCAEHVEFQLPNAYSRVGYLLDAIETSDASLQAAMALVRNDETPVTGKRSDFEATAACLLPHDPVAKKRNTNPQRNRGAEVSAIDSSKIKSGIGATGVPLRYHKREEYNKLSPAQKKELHEWRESDSTTKKTNPDDKGKRTSSSGSDSHTTKKMKRLISSAVADELKLRKEAKSDTDQKVEDGAYLLSLVQAHASSTTATTPTAAAATPKSPPAVTLQSILKRAANGRN